MYYLDIDFVYGSLMSLSIHAFVFAPLTSTRYGRLAYVANFHLGFSFVCSCLCPSVHVKWKSLYNPNVCSMGEEKKEQIVMLQFI